MLQTQQIIWKQYLDDEIHFLDLLSVTIPVITLYVNILALGNRTMQ